MLEPEVSAPRTVAVEIPLARGPTGWRFAGSVGVRGPASPPSWDGIGLSRDEEAGLRFVLAWLGAPFDAVGHGKHGLTWGCWPLNASGLADILATWADAHEGDSPVALLGSEISVVESVTGRRLLFHGEAEQAEQRLLAAPDAVRALVELGRNPELQLLQVRWVARRVVRPLRHVLPARPGGRQAAIGIALARRLGVRAVRDLLRMVETTDGWEQRVMERLQRHGRAAEVSLCRWILNSPELVGG